jgi:hypothetical protein
MKRILIRDQEHVLKPDYPEPFINREDAIQRLLPYHLYHYSDIDAWMEWESLLPSSTKSLADSFLQLYHRYNTILKKEAIEEPIPIAVDLSLTKCLLASELHELNELRASLGMPISNEASSFSLSVHTPFPSPSSQ